MKLFIQKLTFTKKSELNKFIQRVVFTNIKQKKKNQKGIKIIPANKLSAINRAGWVKARKNCLTDVITYCILNENEIGRAHV